jgi:hypothetical protein
MDEVELLDFYSKNLDSLEDQWDDFCFWEGRFTYEEADKKFNNEDSFWDFVKDMFNKQKDLK